MLQMFSPWSLTHASKFGLEETNATNAFFFFFLEDVHKIGDIRTRSIKHRGKPVANRGSHCIKG